MPESPSPPPRKKEKPASKRPVFLSSLSSHGLHASNSWKHTQLRRRVNRSRVQAQEDRYQWQWGGVYISHPRSSHDILARQGPLNVPDSPLHLHPHHYDPVTVSVPVPTNRPSASTPRCTSRTHVRTTTATAPDWTSAPPPRLPPGRATYDERDHGQQLSQPYAAHEPGRDVSRRPSSRTRTCTRTRPSTSMGMRMSTTAGARMPRASVARARARRGRGWGTVEACVSSRCLPPPFFVGLRLAACAIRARVRGLWVCARRPTPFAARRFNSPSSEKRSLCAFQRRDSHYISEVATSKGAWKARVPISLAFLSSFAFAFAPLALAGRANILDKWIRL
ncbi:hypothetical protein B0H13DRAFT_2549767 [Mycena leptocephala]|nr:hypothetical protein B0H13DRAFT_2549767 [Mycena leptocephala]